MEVPLTERSPALAGTAPPPARRRGALADLPEMAWGTPDADALAHLLVPLTREDLDQAAADGTLRTSISDLSARRDAGTQQMLAGLAERPQVVRHVFRAPLDWTDPAVWDAHRALVDAFGDDVGIARLAGVHLAGIDTDAAPAPLWTAMMNGAAAQGKLEDLLAAAAEDVASGGWSDWITSALARPWRVDVAAATGAVPAVRPTPEVPEDRGHAESPSPPGRKRRVRRATTETGARPGYGVAGAGLGIVAGVGLVTAVGYWAKDRAPWERADPKVLAAALALPEPTVAAAQRIAGTATVDGAVGVLVLTHQGRRIATVPAGGAFAFDVPVDGSDDGWAVTFARTDAPCPPEPLPLDRDHLAAQSWTVPVVSEARPATPDERGYAEGANAGCRLVLAGLEGVEPGDLVALDAATVAPVRYARVYRVVGARAEAFSLADTWPGGCHACSPVAVDGVDPLEGEAGGG